MQYKMRELLILLLMVSAVSCSNTESRQEKYLQSAKSHLHEGNRVKAKLDLKNVLQINPKHAEASYLLAEQMEVDGDMRSAASLFQRTLEEDPQFVDAYARLARLYLLGGGVEEAAPYLEQALQLDGDHAESLALRALMALNGQDREAGQQWLQQSLKSDPTNKTALLLQATMLGQTGDQKGAQQVLEQLMSHYPKDLPVKKSMVTFYINQEQPEKAIELMQKIIEQEPEEWGHQAWLAGLLVKLNRTTEAKELLLQNLERKPESITPYIGYVQFLQQTEGEDSAEKELQRLITSTKRGDELQLYQANMLLEKGDTAAATQLLQSLSDDTRTEKVRLSAKISLARLSFAEKDIVKAKRLIEEVQKERSSYPKALALEADIALQEGRADTAVANLRELLKIDDSKLLYREILARALVQQGEYELAEEQMRRLVSSAPNNHTYKLMLAEIYLKSEQVHLAEEFLSQIPKDSNEYLVAQRQLSTIALRQSDAGRALAIANEVLAIEPADSSLGHYLLGRALLLQKKEHEAAKNFEKAYQRTPTNREIYIALLSSLHKLEASTEAEELIKSSLDNGQHIETSHLYLARLKAKQEKYSESISQYETVLDMQPQFLDAHVELAQVIFKQGNKTQAIQKLEEGLQQTDYEFALVDLVTRIHLEDDNFAQAEKVFQQAINVREQAGTDALDPQYLAIKNNLAMYLLDRKEDRDSLARADELTRSFEGFSNANYLDTRGWVLVQLGETDRAVQLLEKAKEIKIDNPTIWFHLGEAYHQLGEPLLAKEHFKQALEIGRPFQEKSQTEQRLVQMDKG
ncbi:MAG TPA: hypothetical protein DCZ03_05165 [Gammaproteobacteria bacterium]|nr:hypothetical protein [Gammaproteobacteria bacterium]